MKDRKVIIITGHNMKDMSNNLYELNVLPGHDHTFTLTDFILRNKIELTNKEFAFSHLMVRMASNNNIVIFQCQTFYILALPPELNEFQLEKLNELKALFLNKDDSLCLINIKKEEKQLIYEDYSSKNSNKVYDSLIEEKISKPKIKQKDLKLSN